MAKLKTLRILEDKLGEVPKSGLSGQSLYYSASWEEIRKLSWKAAQAQYREAPEDVREAGYALDLLGIPYESTEAELDDQGNWIVYWR